MKRKIFSLIGILAFVLLFLPKNVSATEQLDQQCSGAPDEQVPSGGAPFHQTFKPALDRLTKISVYISDENRSDTLALQNEGGTTITSTSLTVSAVNWYTFTLSQAAEVTPGATYRLTITTAQIMTTWGNVHSGCYANGQGYLNDGPYGGDWQFQTYGYNYSTAGSTPATADQGTGTAPTANTSSSITKPTAVKAEYLAEQKGAKVSWVKSTTADIDGYRVYRSEEKTKGFSKVGEVKKTILEYLDATVANEKTYYYYVRAYKGTAESVSSDTATVQIPAAAVATATTTPAPITSDQTPKPSWLSLNWPYVAGSAAVLLLGFGLIFFKYILPKIRAKKAPQTN